MKPLFTMKKSIKTMTITASLISGLILTPVIAYADNDRGKSRNKGGEYSSQKHHDKGRYDRSHRSGQKQFSHKRKDHRKKHGHAGQSYKKHKHHDRRYRHNHAYGHNHNQVINRYVVRDYGHSHDYYDYDPRLSIGLHLGHFDLYFEE